MALLCTSCRSALRMKVQGQPCDLISPCLIFKYSHILLEDQYCEQETRA